MNPMQFIIKHIFDMSQRAFSRELDVSQPTVNGWWEKGYCHYEHQVKIRELAKTRGISWDDRWFFEVPADWRNYGREREGHQQGVRDQADQAQ